ncbi:LEC14B protein [Dendrobium catenatum]|uniref:LEC14B protein n=1 Tax=Dendrobium catenatum TaxID=906689 RepID=A0A2I0X1A0_9ASPA|nr:LEC14B protein [Dendrobium catenatum]
MGSTCIMNWVKVMKLVHNKIFGAVKIQIIFSADDYCDLIVMTSKEEGLARESNSKLLCAASAVLFFSTLPGSLPNLFPLVAYQQTEKEARWNPNSNSYMRMREDKNSVDVLDKSFSIDEEISQLTKLRTEPSENLRKTTFPRQKLPIPIVRMLFGREAMGRFTIADCSHAVGRYLPVNGPWSIDSMDSRAYVSQFSDDGSLLVAGFQGSNIRVYDVENQWKVRKNILARSLHWTITDTSLSPNKRLLVSAGHDLECSSLQCGLDPQHLTVCQPCFKIGNFCIELCKYNIFLHGSFFKNK